MADTRNRREIVEIGSFQPYTHPEHGVGAIREIRYIDGTVERRFVFHDTVKEGESPEAGYVVGPSTVDSKIRAEWDKNTPADARTTPRTPEQQAADAADATTKQTAAANATRIANESAWNADPANRASGGSGRYEDHATRDARLDKEKKEAEAKTERDAANNRGTTTLKPDGKGGTIAVTTYPDGRAPTTAPVPGVPSEASSKYAEVKQDPNTGKWSGLTRDGRWEEIAGGPGVTGNQPLPQGMPTFRPDPNAPDGAFGTVDYAQQLAALRSQGKITDKQMAEFIGYSHQQATAAASRLDTIRTAQQQQQTNEITQRNADLQASTSRLNAANTATQNALDTSQKMAGNFTNKSYAAFGDGSILDMVMNAQDLRAGQWGGLDQPARIGTQNYPMLGQMNQMGMTAPAGPVLPAVAQLTNMGNPNQIGAGAVGATPAPGQPAPAGAPVAAAPGQVAPAATPGAAPQLGQGQDLSTPGAVSASPAAQPAPTAAPQQAAPQGSVWIRDTQSNNRQQVTPEQAERGFQVGQPGSPWVYESSPPQAMAQPGAAPQQQQMIPAALQAGVMAEMAGTGKYPDDVLQQAAAELGWL